MDPPNLPRFRLLGRRGLLPERGRHVFLLPRDQFPAWLTIILGNYAILAAILLDIRGLSIFRGRPVHWWWELGTAVSFCAALVWFTYAAPNSSARIVVVSL
ncbi:hypothetical protein [uncultured Thiodictyon sp.]|uniref:hypothetical protein n=1 Tax=uncultured Thiodictyon sp. TaxID=1846217 RepID=UPI0025FFAD7F|nr:hypothetical protein [uncultured Thiodictyon sp.]